MTTEQLAAAMERNAYTLDDGTPCRCERCAHHRDAAQRLRELEARLSEAHSALRECGALVAFTGCVRDDDSETPTNMDAFPCSADDSPVRETPDKWCDACSASDAICQALNGYSIRTALGRVGGGT